MNLPATIHFSIGCFNGPCWDVELKSAALIVRSNRAGHIEGDATTVTPTAEAWSQFWQAIEAADVWSWLPDYTDNTILDGTQWELELAHAGRSVKCEGSNAYPGHNAPGYEDSPQFLHFLTALRTITGMKGIR